MNADLGSTNRFKTSVIALALGILIGCTPEQAQPLPQGKPAPKGRILQNGLAVKPSSKNLPPGEPGFRVIFMPIGKSDLSQYFEASILAEQPGSFELVNLNGKPIPPGKYRLAVLVGIQGRDELKGKFSPEASPIEVEVKEGEDLIVDLDKYK